MVDRVQIVSILASGILFFIVFEAVRRRRLMERYALLWLGSTIMILALAVWRDLLEEFAATIGIFYAPSALFAFALACILSLLLHFSLVVSRLADQNKVLAQKMALLQTRIEELEREREASPAYAESSSEPEPPRRITAAR